MTAQKPLKALIVAEYLILKAQKEGKDITNKKLQKLLYYVQAWSAAIKNEKIFEDKIEAWIHGPAIREVYLEYKIFGAEPIKKKVSKDVEKAINSGARELIDDVWSKYSKFDAPYLEYLTHSEEPWQKARNGVEPHISSENEITFESMRDYYQKKLKK